MDHDINKRQTWLIKVHNWEFPGNDHNQLWLFGKKVFFFWERFWQSFLEQLITVSSLYKTAHEILYSQVWKSTHTSKTFLKVPIPKRGLLFEENEAFDCQTSEFLKKTSVFHKKKCWFIFHEKVWQKFTLEYSTYKVRYIYSQSSSDTWNTITKIVCPYLCLPTKLKVVS